MSHIPGEIIELALTTTGQESGQAVGHLSDGTMMVVEGAKKYIGQTKKVEIIRSLQTDAGRMMFAKLANNTNHSTTTPKQIPQALSGVQRQSSPRKRQTDNRQSNVNKAPNNKPVKSSSGPKPQQYQAKKNNTNRLSQSQHEDELVQVLKR